MPEPPLIAPPHDIDLDAFGILRFALSDDMEPEEGEMWGEEVDGYWEYSAEGTGRLTIKTDSQNGGLEREIELSCLNVEFKLRVGANVDDASAYEGIVITYLGLDVYDAEHAPFFLGTLFDFDVATLKLEFDKGGSSSNLIHGELQLRPKTSERNHSIPNSPFTLTIGEDFFLAYVWEQGEKWFGSWDMNGLSQLYLNYYKNGSSIVSGNLVPSNDSVVVVFNFDELPNELLELKNVSGSCQLPTQSEPFNLVINGADG